MFTLKLPGLAISSLVNLVDLFIFTPIKIIVKLSENGQHEEMLSTVFYSEEPGERTLLLLISTTAGALFGAVHCIAWNFSFPSHPEQMMWRTASLGIIASCATAFHTTVFWHGLNIEGGIWILLNVFVYLGVLLCFVAALVYPIARIILLILAITSLRSLPPSAFDTIDWVELVPHI